MINISTLLKHYKREDVRQAIIDAAQNKEIGILFGEKGFGKRPDVLVHTRDILELAKQGATSFHCSEELWSNPLQINLELKKQEIEELRIGWDLIIDIDCKFLEYSQITADLIVQALKYNDVENISVKFSGNHGFHIGVPFEAFPEKVNEYETKTLFPDGPRKIAAYLQQMITPFLKNKILESTSVENLIKQTELKYEEIIKDKEFNPFSFVSIDTILISSRHLYRMPYSFNEKSGLISIPIKPEKIMSFDKELAKPENVVVELKFLDKENIIKGSARKLLVQAFDSEIEKEENKVELRQKEFEGSLTAVPEEYFPPCMKNILKGLKDGRKRCLFILTNFLSCVGWDFDTIEKFILDWNKKNMEPLREGIIKSHINYHKRNKKKVLPPNCFNKQYYVDLGFCQPDNFCPKIKNPANYAILKQKITNINKTQEKNKKETKTISTEHSKQEAL